MNPQELKFLNAFNSIPNLGPSSLRLLKNHFGNFAEAWHAGNDAFKNIGLEARTREGLLWKKPSINPDREMEKMVKEKIWIITEDDNLFPNILKEIPYPPLLLYGTGNPQTLGTLGKSKTCVAVVGTRKPTGYGLQTCEKIASELASSGIVITSGLAIGIDTKAHQTTLDNKGATVAIIGSGIDQPSIFPPENQGLARKIVEAGGLVISEYAPGTPAVKEHFPQRNRIISGLSRGVVVIEARERSGALITARFALDQNREVFAVPGSIFSLSAFGPHKLIRDGAKLITSARDVLEELGLDYTGMSGEIFESLDEQEKIILGFLEEPLGIDVLKEKTKLDTSVVMTSLSLLELKGLIRNLGQDTYQKNQ